MSDAPSASEVERFLARTDIVPHVQCKALIGRLAAYVRDLEGARERAEGERDDIAYRVEHPELAHLHYDGCPYKPWADVPRWEEPEDRPDCTCGEAAKGAYWKGQHLLERMKHNEAKARLRDLEAALQRLAGHHHAVTHQGRYETCETAICREAREALSPPAPTPVAPAAEPAGGDDDRRGA